MAKETNANDYDVDLGLYEYAKSNCGACHPGGGAMEYDRQGNRYDQYLSDGNVPANLNGDYYYYNSTSGNVELAPWHTAGVLEIDCLLCHMEGYSTNDRATEVKAGRFYASPGAGAGFYAAVDPGTQKVAYNGSLSIALNDSAHHHNCAQCHCQDENGYTTNSGNVRSDVKKRGFAWGAITGPAGYDRDVHDAAGISCTECHEAGIDHQIAKGHDKIGTVRDDLDFRIQSCGECHTDATDDDDLVGLDPTTAHDAAGFGGIYSFHMNKIDCTTCHIPTKDTTALRTIEIAGGAYPLGKEKYGLFVNGSPASPSAWTAEGLKPTYSWWPDANGDYKIFPQNMMTILLWAEKNASDELSYALMKKDMMAAAEAAGIDATWDDTGDGKAEVNTAQEISDMRAQIIAQGVATGNPNISDPHLWVMPHLFSMSHNIRPAGDAFGAAGCADCHDSGTWIFDGSYNLFHYEMEDSASLASHLSIVTNDGSSEDIHIDFSQAGHNYLENWKMLGYSQSERDQLVIPR